MTRVLIIDDDATLREAIRAVLELEGFDVTLADDGNQATGALSLLRADVVLCDMYMPGKEGIQTIKELRRDFPDVKIIAMSGGGSSGKHDVLNIARHLGATSVIAKPLSKAALVSAIRQVLEKP